MGKHKPSPKRGGNPVWAHSAALERWPIQTLALASGNLLVRLADPASLWPVQSVCMLGFFVAWQKRKRLACIPTIHTASRSVLRAWPFHHLPMSAALVQVGETMAGAGRCSLEFQLHARPDAVIDFREALLAAGHPIEEQCARLPLLCFVLCHMNQALCIFKSGC